MLTGVFAITVFAATDAVLRLPPIHRRRGAGHRFGRRFRQPQSGQRRSADCGFGRVATGCAVTTAPPSGTSPPSATTPPSGTTPAPVTPAAGAGGASATKEGGANDSSAEDTNVDEAAEGPRRAAPAKPSDDEAPEFRESADNNITLPVDI